jgi:hypothetical protein
MTVYTNDNSGTTRGREDAARPPDTTARTAPTDARLVAFAEWIASIDGRDWKAGLAATRKLRQMGLSVCLTTPPGRGGAA